jgi:hypothetical protein
MCSRRSTERYGLERIHKRYFVADPRNVFTMQERSTSTFMDALKNIRGISVSKLVS